MCSSSFADIFFPFFFPEIQLALKCPYMHQGCDGSESKYPRIKFVREASVGKIPLRGYARVKKKKKNNKKKETNTKKRLDRVSPNR